MIIQYGREICNISTAKQHDKTKYSNVAECDVFIRIHKNL